MRLKISHTTTYSYDNAVHYALLQLRLRPRNGSGQTVEKWTHEITGADFQCAFDDQFRNRVDLLTMSDNDHVTVHCEGEVEVENRAGIVGPGQGFVPLWIFQQNTPATAPGPSVRRILREFGKGGEEDGLGRMHALSSAILDSVAYEIGETHSATTAEEAASAGRGVCQDHAHIMISAARLDGHPARYVSGYLMMDGVTEQEASHAWCEVWLNDLGWVGYDVSNGISPDDRYVRVAVGRDYAEAAPVHGLWQGQAREELCVSLQVQQ